jgi:hypothetical protein
MTPGRVEFDNPVKGRPIMATARKDDSNKVEEYRRTLQKLAMQPNKNDGKKDKPSAEQEGKAAKLATEIQAEQSKAPPVTPTPSKR